MLAQDIAPDPQRCAIYTRKSVDLGLDQEFNSLEIQRSICSAYVTSQRHKGWIELPRHYDDGGRSGATLDRPELQALLADIERGLIDIVIVYKLDRISRTLLDFVRLMDFFERYDVAFVSITQNFDTSDSMGRLILNVLLTFAQFEREIMADRIRDKARLLRQAGRWAGGVPPLGYCVRKRILRVVPSEARTVRFMFEKFVEVGSFSELSRECGRVGITGRACNRKRNRESGVGVTPSPSTLNSLLGNPVYIGFIRAGVGKELIAAAHDPLIDKALWDQVQEIRSRIHARRKRRRHKPDLLRKILFDCYGRLMTRHYSCREDRFNDYYASLQNEWGRRQGQKALWVRADAVEQLICAALQNLLTNKALVRAGLLEIGCVDRRMEKLTERTDSAAKRVSELKPRDLRELIRSTFLRIELSTDRIKAVVRWREVERYLAWDGKGLFKSDEGGWNRCTETHLIDIPFSTTRGRRKSLAAPATANVNIARNPKPQLIELIQEARKAQALQDSRPTQSVCQLAKQVHRKDRHFERLLRLNYLAPDIVTSILNGTQPAGLTRKALSCADLPLDWALQRRILGFPPVPE